LRHIHGEILKARCTRCGACSAWREDLDLATACPACGARGAMRVDVVWFGEMPFHMDEVYEALGGCGIFVSIGTSGAVYPAAGFVAEARAAGARTIELNLEPSEGATLFAEAEYGPAAAIVPAFVERLLAGR
jgi:NAD-dependent deacetylase